MKSPGSRSARPKKLNPDSVRVFHIDLGSLRVLRRDCGLGATLDKLFERLLDILDNEREVVELIARRIFRVRIVHAKNAASLAILALLMMFSASPIALASESESTRFKASFSGPFQIIASTLTTITVAVTGEGRATHLGDSDLSATVTIVLATGVGTSTDTTITGASGDEDEGNLFLTTVTSETPPSPQGIIILSGTYTITAGTGELGGATVSGPVSGTVPIPAGTFPRASAGP